jgi:hypothetical protein
MMFEAKGNLHVLVGGLRVKARVQHPQVKPRKDRTGWPWVFRYRADEVQPDGTVKTLRKYQEIGPRKGEGALTKKQANLALHLVATGQVSTDELVRIQKFQKNFRPETLAKMKITDRWWDEPWKV